MGSMSAADWVESAYEVLRCHVTASDPVGCEQTGYLVEFGIDYDRDDLADEILERVDGRESLAVLLATAVLAVLEIRTAVAEDSDGCRLILPGAVVADIWLRQEGLLRRALRRRRIANGTSP